MKYVGFEEDFEQSEKNGWWRRKGKIHFRYIFSKKECKECGEYPYFTDRGRPSDFCSKICAASVNRGDNNPAKRPEVRKKISDIKKIENAVTRPEVRKKLSEINTGKNHPQYGIPKSEITRQRISDANTKYKGGTGISGWRTCDIRYLIEGRRQSIEWCNISDDGICVHCNDSNGPHEIHHPVGWLSIREYENWQTIEDVENSKLLFHPENRLRMCRPCHIKTFGKNPELKQYIMTPEEFVRLEAHKNAFASNRSKNVLM